MLINNLILLLIIICCIVHLLYCYFGGLHVMIVSILFHTVQPYLIFFTCLHYCDILYNLLSNVLHAYTPYEYNWDTYTPYAYNWDT